jgi:hypothetical protein
MRGLMRRSEADKLNSLTAFLTVLVMILITLSYGCKPAPTEGTVRDLITRDFESRHYKVTELEISAVKPSTGEKRYMSRPAYIVDIRSITLEASRDIGIPVIYKKGQKLNFRNVNIEIKEDLYQKGRWVITNIKGMAVP